MFPRQGPIFVVGLHIFKYLLAIHHTEMDSVITLMTKVIVWVSKISGICIFQISNISVLCRLLYRELSTSLKGFMLERQEGDVLIFPPSIQCIF